MREQIEKIAVCYANYINGYTKGERKVEGVGMEEGFKLLRFQSPVSILVFLYNSFIGEGITPLEQLPKETKQKYFDAVKNYYDTVPTQIQASKAAYVLSLITSND